ncbi:MAG: pyridoxamine 5'-phosphate oxidase family protein [Bacteroidetes bacterium]|nr:pyridoxamine 5'-phosphate oxidase family protein [Bacteroidota bacterium]
MGAKTDSLQPHHIEFIQKQHLFFVATATADSRINLSPKGLDSFRIVDQNRIIWLNLTGSGNETAAHLLQNNRMTIMFCAFEGPPLILRLYGTAEIHHKDSDGWEEFNHRFDEVPGARQIIEMEIDLVQISCGYGVPLMDFKENRQTLVDWAQKKGDDGVKDYWREKNQVSLDGERTGIENYIK